MVQSDLNALGGEAELFYLRDTPALRAKVYPTYFTLVARSEDLADKYHVVQSPFRRA